MPKHYTCEKTHLTSADPQIVVLLANVNHAWSDQDHMQLVLHFNKHMNDPDGYPLSRMEWEGRTSKEVQLYLEHIRSSGNTVLGRYFPSETSRSIWTTEDDADLHAQLEVRPEFVRDSDSSSP